MRAAFPAHWQFCLLCAGGREDETVGIQAAVEAVLDALGYSVEVTSQEVAALNLPCPNCSRRMGGAAWHRVGVEPGWRVVHVPKINAGPGDFRRLFDIADEAVRGGSHVRFDFSRCNFLRPNAVAVLGAIARGIQSKGHDVEFRWESLNGPVLMNLKQNGFYSAFGGVGGPWSGNSVPYLELPVRDPEAAMSYLTERWLGRGWVGISVRLRDLIASRVYELFENAFDHARSPVGMTCCGQFFPGLRSLQLAVVDVGIGIPSNVRVFLDEPSFASGAALEWAFRHGTTTSVGQTARGLGLDLLKSFIRVNGGELRAYSLDGIATVDASNETYDSHAGNFGGTVVYISVQCDERHYRLAWEPSSTPFF